jgi:hypothetical protein
VRCACTRCAAATGTDVADCCCEALIPPLQWHLARCENVEFDRGQSGLLRRGVAKRCRLDPALKAYLANHATGRGYFSMRRLLVTENTPETPLARIPAMFLSASVATTPSSVTFPFFTIMWTGGTAWIEYRSMVGSL